MLLGYSVTLPCVFQSYLVKHLADYTEAPMCDCVYRWSYGSRDLASLKIIYRPATHVLVVTNNSCKRKVGRFVFRSMWEKIWIGLYIIF